MANIPPPGICYVDVFLSFSIHPQQHVLNHQTYIITVTPKNIKSLQRITAAKMSNFLNLPSPPLPADLQDIQKRATRQEPGSGFSANIRPLRARLTPATAHLANPFHPRGDPAAAPNQLMVQAFEWYIPPPSESDPTTHWQRLKPLLPSLAHLGTTHLWIPPACKAARPHGNGYDIYDLYDLGEFDQKGSTRTKWGSKSELVELTEAAAAAAAKEEGQQHGIKVLFDAVLNHKTGADRKERARATKLPDERDRTKEGEAGAKEQEVEVWTGFEFPGRTGTKGEGYSRMKWGKRHFTGVDYDALSGESGVWRLEGKKWADDVDEELGNYDFL